MLAVSSAGMLIRRDVWDQLGGFDPNLPLMREDIDFCWRVHAAGYDVRVITEAVLYHRELSARNIRKVTAAGGQPRLLDRRGALYTFAANLPIIPMLTIVTGCVARLLLRAAYFLLTKQQGRAWDHLARSAGCCGTRACSGTRGGIGPMAASTGGRSCTGSCLGAAARPGWPNRPRACYPVAPPTKAGGAPGPL